jgi:hypothetical protein
MERFRQLEFAKVEKLFSTDEGLQRAMIIERARMEFQKIEKQFQQELSEIRDLLISLIRSKLQQQSTFTSYHQEEEENIAEKKMEGADVRKIAQEELTKLNQVIEGVRLFVIDPKEIDLQLFKARNALMESFSREVTRGFKAARGEEVEDKRIVKSGNDLLLFGANFKFDDEPFSSSSSTMAQLPPPLPTSMLPPAVQRKLQQQQQSSTSTPQNVELSLKDRCKLVVDIKDLCDKIQNRLKLDTPQKIQEAERLIRISKEIANRIPVAATLTLKGTKDELERFIRVYTF